MRPAAALLALLLLASAAASASGAPGDVELRWNPFVRPDLEPEDDGGGAAASAHWRPVLRATLVSGRRSLANLGGVVLGLGDEAHGYRLTEVRAWEAVFEKGGATVVLPVEREEEGARP